MNGWGARFEEHGLWEEVDKIAARLDGAPAPEDDSLRGDLERLQWLLAHLRARRARTNALAVTGAALDATETAVSLVRTNLDSIEDDDWSYLGPAATKIDEVLSALAMWPPLDPSDAAEADRQALDAHRASVEQAVSSLVTQRDELAGEISTLRTAAEEVRAEVDRDKARLDTALQEFSAASTERISEVVTENQTALDDQIAMSETKREEQIETWEADREAQRPLRSDWFRILKA